MTSKWYRSGLPVKTRHILISSLVFNSHLLPLKDLCGSGILCSLCWLKYISYVVADVDEVWLFTIDALYDVDDGAQVLLLFETILSLVVAMYISATSHEGKKNPLELPIQCTNVHLCKLRTFNFSFTASWLKNLVEYSYLLPKHSVKISRGKKMDLLFLFHFL